MNKPLIQRAFLRFFGYNSLFFFCQLLFMTQQSQHFLDAIALPAIVYYELGITLIIHITLYAILSALQTILWWSLNSITQTIRYRVVSIWWLTVSIIFAGNGYFFPNSAFSRLIPQPYAHIIFGISMLVAILILLVFIGQAGYLAVKQGYWRKIRRYWSHQSQRNALSIIAAFLLLSSHYPLPLPDNQQPHIILLGIDSLPPEAISSALTPTIAQFIQQSVYFKETISPLAQTYPAWSSILTGLYPQHHHARYDLMPPKLVNSQASFAWLLQQQGYQTIFATDDRQFNGLGHDFGFQHIIGPAFGINDFILGVFNDFPLSNLLMNTPIAHWFFPYNYLNRASYYTYYPQRFDDALAHFLITRSHVTPLLLAVHFTLPHWPYRFAASSPQRNDDLFNSHQHQQLYQQALTAVDQQLSHLLQTLRREGYLQNSLLILLSDHGETFYLPGSRPINRQHYQDPSPSRLNSYFKRRTSTRMDMSAGHGTDLLSPAQYHCILAMNIYQHGAKITTSKIITERVALIDIAPTITAFLTLPSSSYDGISLLPALTHATALPKRTFMLESGMFPNQFFSRRKAIQLAAQYFTVNSQGQLQLREEKLSSLDQLKLYAILKNDWLVALYPDGETYLPIIQHLSDGQWGDHLQTHFATHSAAAELLTQLQTFYGQHWAIQ